MNDELKEIKNLLEDDIRLLGYEKLRYSIFEGSENGREEYQLRMEKSENTYDVYMTADRASVMGKYKFESPFDAMDKFLDIMQSRVLTNRRKVRDGEPPEYPCPLWDKAK
ncbi:MULTISPECIES: Imm59 family immunity protein [Listeria]|uniref:Imm59 family immunity protein n=1 Tax=Listeria TaxID=1637 RepID=UPI000B593E49|nr:MULTISPECIES: Imm59 family immunity protein [Listeria]